MSLWYQAGGRARGDVACMPTHDKAPARRNFWRDNGLSLVMFGLFFVTIVGQALTGWRAHNAEQADHGQPAEGLGGYLTSGDFVESVFENWESEFLQMGAFVLLTRSLRQRGSGESKKLPDEGDEEVDKDPSENVQPDSPGPVHRGGLALKLYSQSLSLALFGLFLFSFALHAVGGTKRYNDEQRQHGAPTVSVARYVGSSQFWFESFQNWQSEFLSVGAIVVLSIFLRQRGSPESKPVHMPHRQTGE
jgi:hypothetical protein